MPPSSLWVYQEWKAAVATMEDSSWQIAIDSGISVLTGGWKTWILGWGLDRLDSLLLRQQLIKEFVDFFLPPCHHHPVLTIRTAALWLDAHCHPIVRISFLQVDSSLIAEAAALRAQVPTRHTSYLFWRHWKSRYAKTLPMFESSVQLRWKMLRRQLQWVQRCWHMQSPRLRRKRRRSSSSNNNSYSSRYNSNQPNRNHFHTFEGTEKWSVQISIPFFLLCHYIW